MKDLYKTTNLSRVLFLRNQLYTLKMSEGEDIGEHLTKVKKIRDQLTTINQKVDSTELALLVLNNFPGSFHTFVTTITLDRQENAVTFENLCRLLVMEDRKLKSYEGEASGEQAFTVQHIGKKQQQKKPTGKPKADEEDSKGKSAKKIICWNCGEKDQKRPKCKKPKKEKKGEERDNLFLVTDDGAHEDLSLPAMDASARDAGRYVDFRAMKHMPNRKEWYEKLEIVDASSTVTLGDNSICAMKGKEPSLYKRQTTQQEHYRMSCTSPTCARTYSR